MARPTLEDQMSEEVVELELAADGGKLPEMVAAEFERLVSSQTLELLVHRPAMAPILLAELQSRYGPAFDWWPLEQRSDGLRIQISPREGLPRTISDFLGSDHHRLSGYWEEFLQAIKACEMSNETLFTAEKGHRLAASERLSHFIFGLRRHIRMEEDCFFPLFEARSGMPAGSGPTAVMRTEHREIEEILASMERLLDAHECATLIQAVEGRPTHPSTLFRNHDSKEENMLYPLSDRLFSQSEKDQLCLRMQAVMPVTH
jgi:regulator of cell morphogenesis and NO signaling